MTWTCLRLDVDCGAVPGCRIPPGEPVAVLAGTLYRCAAHAGAPVDRGEVELERWRLEEELRREAAARLAPPPAPPVRVAPMPKRVRPFRELAGAGVVDPRARQFKDGE